MSRCLRWSLALGLALGGCRPYEPTEPVEETAQACCTAADQQLQNFAGCRPSRGECRARKGEKFWMRGRVSCGPVDEAACEGGRCCHYLPMYGAPAPEAETASQQDPGAGPPQGSQPSPDQTEAQPASDAQGRP